MRKTIAFGNGGWGWRSRWRRRARRRRRNSRSASCPAWSIPSIRSCSSAWRRRPRTSASRSSRRFRRPGGSQAQTPLLDAMVARGDLNYIITAPVDKDQMVGPLQAAVDHGIKVITVDTFLGDGDYVNGPVKFPISYIGSDNVEGGRIAARGLAKAIGGKGTVYINSTNPNVSSVEGRAQGFKEEMAKDFPEHQGARTRLQSGRRQQGGAADRGGAGARTQPRRRLRHQRVQRARARARRSSTPDSAATSRSSPTTRPSRRSS